MPSWPRFTYQTFKLRTSKIALEENSNELIRYLTLLGHIPGPNLGSIFGKIFVTHGTVNKLFV